MRSAEPDFTSEATHPGFFEVAAADPARAFVSVVSRRKRTVLGASLVCTVAVAVASFWTPQTFMAESSLLVRMGREYIYRSEIGRSDAARMPSLSEIVNSEVEILSSRDLAELVVLKLGVQKLYPEFVESQLDAGLAREKAVLRFRQATSIRPVLESSVIKVSYEHVDPQIAAAAVNLLVESFKDKHVEVFSEERSSGLEDQHAERRAELMHAEEAVAEFKKTSGLFDFDEQRRILLEQRMRGEEDLRNCELALAETPADESRDQPEPASAPLDVAGVTPDGGGAVPNAFDALERSRGSVDHVTAQGVIEQASLRLLELQLEEHQLARDYRTENRRVQGVRAEMELLQEFLRQARARAGVYDQARREALAHELADLDQRLQDLYEQEKKLRRLERELTAAESALQIIRERVEEARIGEELDRQKSINVRVIEKAAAPVVPSGLSLGLKIVLGAFVSLLVGVSLAVLEDSLSGPRGARAVAAGARGAARSPR